MRYKDERSETSEAACYTETKTTSLCHYLYPNPHFYPNRKFWRISKGLPENIARSE